MRDLMRKGSLILALLGLLGLTAHAAGLIGRCVARCPTHGYQCGKDDPHLGLHWCPATFHQF